MTLPPREQPVSITGRGPRMPDAIRPMLARATGEPFDSSDHLFELMWGGLRTMAYVRDGRLMLRARNGRDVAAYFPELHAIPGYLAAREAILDGEVIALGAEGQPEFDALRPRLHAMAGDEAAGAAPRDLLKPRKVTGQLCFQAFDILWLDGRPLLDRPLWQRKNRLHETVRAVPELSAVDFVDNEGMAFFEAVLQRKLEGIVAKRKNSVYAPGVRSRDWLEIRAFNSGDFVIGGYTFGGTRRKGDPFGSLLLGAYDGEKLRYVGSVSGGMSDSEARQIVALLEPCVADAPAFARPPAIARLIYWTRPELVCHVRFSEWSRDGMLRFPIFSALRPDLVPAECTAD
jgi:DNA ligase D-like protein (predicted ligase)